MTNPPPALPSPAKIWGNAMRTRGELIFFFGKTSSTATREIWRNAIRIRAELDGGKKSENNLHNHKEENSQKKWTD
jgi:hypothetical protein